MLGSAAPAVVRRLGVRTMGTILPTPSSFSGLRSLGSLGPWMRDQPSEVAQMQKFYGHTMQPTYFKGPADKAYFYSISGVSIAGLILVFSGAFLGLAPPPPPPHTHAPCQQRVPVLPPLLTAAPLSHTPLPHFCNPALMFPLVIRPGRHDAR